MNRTKKILLVILILLFILCAVGFVCCTYNTAHADSEIVTFNQYYKAISSDNNIINVINDNTLRVNNTTTGTIHISLQQFTFVEGHTYYIKVNEEMDNWNAFVHNGQGIKYFKNSQIFTRESTSPVTYLYIYANETPKDIIINVFDLSLMYGENIPDNETIYNTFTALYYPYTTGTIMYSNGIEQYNNALNDIFSSYTFHTNIDALAKDTFAVEYNSQEANFIYDSENSAWYFLNTFGVPLSIGLKQGSRITINYNVFAGGGSGQSQNLFLNIMYNNGNNFVNLYTDPNGIQLSAMDNQSLTFILPTAVDCLYFNIYNSDLNKVDTRANLILVQFEINCSQLDITSALNNSLLTGIKQGHEDFNEGTQNYKMIFDKGYNEAVMRLTADASLKFMDYFSQAFQILGSILNIEVFPNVTLGSFFLLPIMTSLLFFIIKLVKGGD